MDLVTEIKVESDRKKKVQIRLLETNPPFELGR